MSKKDKAKKIGVFGGLFDPPHIAHLIITQWVMEEFGLNKIIFIPAANPPHKSKYSPYTKRYEMTTLAIKGNNRFFISNIEKNISGKTYTIEVIKRLKKKIKGELYFIIGADQWEEIETWKNPESLFNECQLIVIPRPGYVVKKKGKFYEKILISHAPLIDISSTAIRKRVKQNLNIQYLVPKIVDNYIKRRKLYK